jgi:hypothetical protein
MRLLRNSRGIAIVYVTLFLMVLGILFFALGVDIGWMAYVKTQGQAATDASALAGAAAIPNVNSTSTTTMAETLATAPEFDNSNTVMQAAAGIVATDVVVCDGNPASPTCPAADLTKAGGVRVTKTYNTPLIFTRLLNGAPSTNISVSSIAWLGSPAGLGPTLPITLCRQQIYTGTPPTCITGTDVDLNPNNQDNGAYWNFDASDPNSTSQPTPTGTQCPDWVLNPDHIPYISIDQYIGLNNGQITNCMQEIRQRFNSCSPSDCPADPAQQNPACVVILPVIDCAGSIVQQEPVKEFAAMCITDVRATPASQAYIRGELTCDITAPGSIGGGGGIGIYAQRPVLVQ